MCLGYVIKPIRATVVLQSYQSALLSNPLAVSSREQGTEGDRQPPRAACSGTPQRAVIPPQKETERERQRERDREER